jgi:hypothetical protein
MSHPCRIDHGQLGGVDLLGIVPAREHAVMLHGAAVHVGEALENKGNKLQHARHEKHCPIEIKTRQAVDLTGRILVAGVGFEPTTFRL